MKSYVWTDLDEEGRYKVWSEHLDAGGQMMAYPEFCDLMDEIHA